VGITAGVDSRRVLAGVQLAEKVRPDPHALAGTVLDAVQDNGYGQYDGLVGIMAPALGDEGLAALKSMVEELGRSPLPVPPKDQWKAVGWGTGGTTYEHEMRACVVTCR
ncbi:DUF6880 family protein, partial [uncultured Paracoccus sp.]|uniref:DUF6880 family protein n=1 Tax=uncultured Paracoccus sp. TaxID=189685 RepID=UPI00344C47E5